MSGSEATSSISKPGGRWNPFRSSSGVLGGADETFSNLGGSWARTGPGTAYATTARAKINRAGEGESHQGLQGSNGAARAAASGVVFERDPAEEADRRPLGVVQPDLAVALVRVVDGRGEGHSPADEPLLLGLQVLDLEDEPHLVAVEARRAPPLEGEPAATRAQQRILVRRRLPGAAHPQGLDVPADRARPVRDLDLGQEELEAGRSFAMSLVARTRGSSGREGAFPVGERPFSHASPRKREAIRPGWR